MIGGKQQKSPPLPQQEPLTEVASHLLEECRMVLPGIQALFGFQLIAVFNAKFSELPAYQQTLHLVAISLVAIAVALVMTPAAYHRLAHKNSLSQQFITLSSWLLLSSMLPLMLGISVDFYLIASMITGHEGLAVTLGLALMIVFAALWFILPYSARR